MFRPGPIRDGVASEWGLDKQSEVAAAERKADDSAVPDRKFE